MIATAKDIFYPLYTFGRCAQSSRVLASSETNWIGGETQQTEYGNKQWKEFDEEILR